MHVRHCVGFVYLCTVLLSNVCLTSLVQAAPTRDDSTLPMTPYATACPWARVDADAPAENPCASGHCLTVPMPDTPCFAVSVHEQSAATLPCTLPSAETAFTTDYLFPSPPDRASWPPGSATVVLRL